MSIWFLNQLISECNDSKRLVYLQKLLDEKIILALVAVTENKTKGGRY